MTSSVMFPHQCNADLGKWRQVCAKQVSSLHRPSHWKDLLMQAAELEAVLAERTQQMSQAGTTLKLKEMEFQRRVTKLQKEHAVKVATVLHQMAAVVPAGMSPATAVVPASTSPDTAAAAQGTAYLVSIFLSKMYDDHVGITFHKLC